MIHPLHFTGPKPPVFPRPFGGGSEPSDARLPKDPSRWGGGSGGSGGSGGGGSSLQIRHREQLQRILDAYPHPTIAFVPPPPEGYKAVLPVNPEGCGAVLLVNPRVETIFGHSALTSLWHFFDTKKTREFTLLDGAIKQLAFRSSATLASTKLRDQKGRWIDCRVTVEATTWFSERLGLCFIEDLETCRRTLTSLEGGIRETQAEMTHVYTPVQLNAAIRDRQSILCRDLVHPDTVEPVQVRIVSRLAAKNLEEQASYDRGLIDVLNMTLRNGTPPVPKGKRLILSVQQEGGGWTTSSEWIQEEEGFIKV